MSGRLSAMRPVPRVCLNRSELAMSLGFSVGSVDEMVREGALPKPRRWRGRLVWLLAEIDAALQEWPTDGEATQGEGARVRDEWRAEA